MTRKKNFKRLVRARMRMSSERYTDARADLLREGPDGQKEGTMIPVRCSMVWVQTGDEGSPLHVDTVEAAGAQLAELEVMTVSGSERKSTPWLILDEVDGNRRLPIAVGSVEAIAVSFALQGIETPRPMTHDLLRDVVVALGRAEELRITELRETVFYAELVVTDQSGERKSISCRPSDGIAFALRADIPIVVEEGLLSSPDASASKLN